MNTRIFSATLDKFWTRLDYLKGRLGNSAEDKWIKGILNALTKINREELPGDEFDKTGLLSLRDDVTDCYSRIIPLGFKLLGLPGHMADQMKINLDKWTALPHFSKFEIDLTESSYTRDHYLHPLCVFAIGVYTISCLLKARFFRIREVREIFASWLFCSLLHDLGYVIEKYSDILDMFFSKFLMVGYSATFNFKDVMFDGNYQRNLILFNDGVRRIAAEESRDEVESLVSKLLYVGNDHGIISALSAYERLDKAKELFDKLILEGDGLRDIRKDKEGIIERIEKRWGKDKEYGHLGWLKDEYMEHIKGAGPSELSRFEEISDAFDGIKKRFHEIVLAIGIHNNLIIELHEKTLVRSPFTPAENPLIFLLLFSDAVQDWGRSINPQTYFYLDSLTYKDSLRQLEVKYITPTECDGVCDKVLELSRTEQYLNADGFITIDFDGHNSFSI